MMTLASARRSRPARVRRPGAPGPAPTMETKPLMGQPRVVSAASHPAPQLALGLVCSASQLKVFLRGHLLRQAQDRLSDSPSGAAPLDPAPVLLACFFSSRQRSAG